MSRIIHNCMRMSNFVAYIHNTCFQVRAVVLVHIQFTAKSISLTVCRCSLCSTGIKIYVVSYGGLRISARTCVVPFDVRVRSPVRSLFSVDAHAQFFAFSPDVGRHLTSPAFAAWIRLLRLLENGVGESVIDITEPNDILQEGI